MSELEYITVPGSVERQSESLWEGGSRASLAGLIAQQSTIESPHPGVEGIQSRYIRLSRRFFEILEPQEQNDYLGQILFKELGSTEKVNEVLDDPVKRSSEIERLTDEDEAARKRYVLARKVAKLAEHWWPDPSEVSSEQVEAPEPV